MYACEICTTCAVCSTKILYIVSLKVYSYYIYFCLTQNIISPLREKGRYGSITLYLSVVQCSVVNSFGNQIGATDEWLMVAATSSMLRDWIFFGASAKSFTLHNTSTATLLTWKPCMQIHNLVHTRMHTFKTFGPRWAKKGEFKILMRTEGELGWQTLCNKSPTT